MPTLDVVIPAHNASSTVGEAIATVQAQTRAPNSIIVVADACEDSTAAVAIAAGVTVLEVDVRSAGAARNAGIRASSAEHVAFLDADDLWRPGWLEAVHRRIDRCPEASLFMGSFEEQSVDGATVRRSPEKGPGAFGPWDLVVGNPVLTSAAVIARRVALSAGLFDVDLRHAEDWDLWLRLAERGPVYEVPGHLVIYRRLPGSLTRARSELLEQRNNALLVLSRACSRRAVPDSLRQKARAMVLKHSAMRCLSHDAARAARVDLHAALSLQPRDLECWALALLTACPPEFRTRAAQARRAARLSVWSKLGG